MAAIADNGSSFRSNCRQTEAETSTFQSPHPELLLSPHYENYPKPRYCPAAAQSYAAANTGFGASADISTLPPLLEASAGETYQIYSRGYQRELCYAPNGARSVPLTGNDVFSYYSSDNCDQALYYLEEELPRRISPIAESRYHSHETAENMGSGSSVQKTDTSSKKVIQKHSKNRRSSTSSSDNGGFESNTSKPSLGVKEKLRYSLDKLSLKSPFRWSSSDKISRNNSSGSSKTKSKDTRRYSDSSTSLLTVNTANEKKKFQKKNSLSDTADNRKQKKLAATSRLVRAYSAGRKSIDREQEFEYKRSSPSNHDYVNIASVSTRVDVDNSWPSNNDRECFHDNVFECGSSRVLNEYHMLQSSKTYHDMSTLPSQHTWENRDTATRAKGTWKMLKAAQTKYLPVKAGSYSSDNTLVNEANVSLVNADTKGQDVNMPALIIEEVSTEEPPKLAPVSGKLLLDKSCQNIILKPTAFRPISQTPSKNSSPISQSPQAKISQQTIVEATSREDAYSDVNERAVSEYSVYDSDHHSVTSIPAVTTNGSSYSCSGSEGYESARISSSTTHSAAQEHDSSADSSQYLTKKLADDVIISDLESRVKERHDEVRILRRNFEDNEKTLHEMVNENRDQIRESNVMELKQKYSHQLKSQTRKASLQTHLDVEWQYRRMHEEQKQLRDTNKEIEERIKSMSDAIEIQSRQNDDIAELRARLEESEIEMQQKHGEISILKRQIKEKQSDLNQRSSESLAIKSYNRELLAKLTQRNTQKADLQALLEERDREIAELERRLTVASSRGSWSTNGSVNSSVFHNSQSAEITAGAETGVRVNRKYEETYFPSSSAHEEPEPKNKSNYHSEEREALLKRLHAAEHRCAIQEMQFETEKQQWAEDKSKVIKYQKQLQSNYVQMYKRSHALEREVNILTSQLQALGVSAVVGMRVSEDYSDSHDLSYPMEI